MDPTPRKGDQKNSAAQLRNVDDTYIFDSASGIYKPKTYEADNKRAQQKTDSPIDIKIRRDWMAFVVAVLTLIVVAGYTYYAQVQASDIRRQTGLLSDQADREVARAIGNAATTEHQLNLLQEQVKAAQDSVVANQRQMRTAQRAWLELTSFNVPLDTPFLTYELVIKNIGNSPVTDASMEISSYVLRGSERPQFVYPEGASTMRFGTIFPNDSQKVTVNVVQNVHDPNPVPLTRNLRAELESKSAYDIIQAYLTYHSLGVAHWYKFCHSTGNPTVMPGSVSGIRDCVKYNQTDNNQ